MDNSLLHLAQVAFIPIGVAHHMLSVVWIIGLNVRIKLVVWCPARIRRNFNDLNHVWPPSSMWIGFVLHLIFAPYAGEKRLHPMQHCMFQPCVSRAGIGTPKLEKCTVSIYTVPGLIVHRMVVDGYRYDLWRFVPEDIFVNFLGKNGLIVNALGTVIFF
ncbi:MAG: hypothetical protein IT540_20615 [Hyphomicrobium sp.]|nr:hypothetical protein [Hyphomicrobium sp.]